MSEVGIKIFCDKLVFCYGYSFSEETSFTVISFKLILMEGRLKLSLESVSINVRLI